MSDQAYTTGMLSQVVSASRHAADWAFTVSGRILRMSSKGYETLVNLPLGDLIKGIGMGVADANSKLASIDAGEQQRVVIPSAKAKVKIAISSTTKRETGVNGGLELSAFSLNATYKSSYSFTDEASSEIEVEFKLLPVATQ